MKDIYSFINHDEEVVDHHPYDYVRLNDGELYEIEYLYYDSRDELRYVLNWGVPDNILKDDPYLEVGFDDIYEEYETKEEASPRFVVKQENAMYKIVDTKGNINPPLLFRSEVNAQMQCTKMNGIWLREILEECNY